jgi:hypothetical protein
MLLKRCTYSYWNSIPVLSIVSLLFCPMWNKVSMDIWTVTSSGQKKALYICHTYICMHMYVYMYMYVYTCIYIFIYDFSFISLWTLFVRNVILVDILLCRLPPVESYSPGHRAIGRSIYLGIYTCVYLCIYIHVFIHIYMHTNTYIYICIHIYMWIARDIMQLDEASIWVLFASIIRCVEWI